MARLFALDHNFPEPIVEVLSEVQEGSGDADLVSVSDIDPRMADLDDWQIMLALHHHERPWDGLITTDSSILNQPPELAVLLQTKLTLIVVRWGRLHPRKSHLSRGYRSPVAAAAYPRAASTSSRSK